MKKIILSFSLVFSILLLSGCDNTDELFEKKQECLSYKDEMLALAEKDGGGRNLEEVFYSSKGNSCYFIVSYYSLGKEQNKVQQFELFDFLSGKSIARRMNCPEMQNCTEQGENNDREYEKRMRELR